MLSLPSKLLLALSGAAFAFAAGYSVAISEKDGVLLLVALAVAALVAGLALRSAGVRDDAPTVPADAPPPERRATTAGGPAWGTAWPLAAALALGVIAVGAAVGAPLTLAGVIVALAVGLGWFGRTWSQHATWTPRVRSRVEERLLVPVALPLGALLLAAVIAISVSRILLAVSERAAVAVAFVVAASIITAFFVVAARPRARSSALAGLAALAAMSLVGAGVAGASSGERKFEPAAATPKSIVIVASGVRYDTSGVTAPDGPTIEIVFHNQDAAIYHNVAVYDDASGHPTPIFNGQGFPGAKTMTYAVPRPAPGTYRFQCDFHVNMKGEFVVPG